MKVNYRNIFITIAFLLTFSLPLITVNQDVKLPGVNQDFSNLPVYVVRESEQFLRLVLKLKDGIAQAYLDRSKVTCIAVSEDGWYLTNIHISDRTFIAALKILIAPDIIPDKNNRIATYESQQIIAHPYLDLLLLKINYEPKFYFKDFKQPYLFEENWVLGFRYGSNKSLSNPGYVTENINPDYQRFLRTTAQVLPGNSGSAVINRKGQVLGIICVSFMGDGGFFPAPVIEQFIKENIK